MESLCANLFSSCVCACVIIYRMFRVKCAEIEVCMIRTFAMPFPWRLYALVSVA